MTALDGLSVFFSLIFLGVSLWGMQYSIKKMRLLRKEEVLERSLFRKFTFRLAMYQLIAGLALAGFAIIGNMQDPSGVNTRQILVYLNCGLGYAALWVGHFIYQVYINRWLKIDRKVREKERKESD